MRVKLAIEFDIPDEVPGYGGGSDSATRATISTICDALGEFQSHRSYDAARYVERRYPPAEYLWMTPEIRAEKIRQVAARFEIAEAIRQAVALARIEVVSPKSVV